MRTTRKTNWAGLLLFAASIIHSLATVHYVDVNNPTPTPPFTNWSTAATTIQDAIDAAAKGDLILVTNGIYETGGRVGSIIQAGFGTNRVIITTALTVQSVNGPDVTIIRGRQSPSSAAVRCVLVTNNATLSGFTLTNGGNVSTSGDGGGVFGLGGSPPFPGAGIVSNCVITGNSSPFGGGAYGVTLIGCVVTRNTAHLAGGGARYCALTNCTLSANSVDFGDGGGASSSGLYNCQLNSNSASSGGGAESCTLSRCRLTGNLAAYGGGADFSMLDNCLVVSNAALRSGGGLNTCFASNCTVVANSATESAGGAACGGTINGFYPVLANCILYSNTAPSKPNYSEEGTLNFSCTTPLPTNGIGNFTNAPLFIDSLNNNFRLQSNSPCINAGLDASASSVRDLDGRTRVVGGQVDLGAYEFQGPGVGEFCAWLEQFSFLTDGSVDFSDADRDGMNNWQEWRAGTVPSDATSVLRLLSPEIAGSDVIVSWSSVVGRKYRLERSSDLSAHPAFVTLTSDLAGLAGVTTYVDTNAASAGVFFYRVGVQP